MVQENPREWVVSRRKVLKNSALASAIGVSGVAGFSSGVAAQSCDRVVDDDGGEDHTTIQDAIDSANQGERICVRAGTYSESVSVNKAVTVTGENDPDGPDAAVVDGSVTVSADNATVSRLKVAPTNTFVAGGLDPHGILVSGELSDVTIKENIVEGMTADNTGDSVTINGIQLWNDGPEQQTGTEVKHNTVRDMDNMGDAAAGWPNYGGAAAIKVQGVVEDTVVAGNTVKSVHSAGWTYGIVTTHTGSAPGDSPTNTTVEMNTIEEVNDGSVYDVFDDTGSAPYPGSAFAIDGDSLASEATANLNNFLKTPIGALNKDGDNTLDAECNYWDHATGPEDEDNKKGKGNNAVGDVDYTPWNTRKVGRGKNPENSCVGGKNAD
ncbi:hypothetical protein [Halobellus ordinarius]|uniref:hypothetical protein n=1 Tax=Halobellus ordinarius TaxID=3075120 RepID=UPI0028805E34|nr:hypothetical protein [Halobellus sp. ZY16]